MEAVFISATHGELPHGVDSVTAIAGRGLVGDRYFDEKEPGRDVTLIEVEALEAIRNEHGIELDGASSRRNVLTRGVRLNQLAGKRFRVGELLCQGIELCQPCLHLQQMTQPGVVKALVHRGGLYAEILTGGILRPGDPIT